MIIKMNVNSFKKTFILDIQNSSDEKIANEEIASKLEFTLKARCNTQDPNDFNQFCHEDGTPFLIHLCKKATNENDIRFIKICLENTKGFNIDIECKNSDGSISNPLHEAIKKGKQALVALLLKNNASPLREDYNHVLLHYCKVSSEKIDQTLIKSIINILMHKISETCLDNNGVMTSPLQAAIQSGNVPMLNILLNSGYVDVNNEINGKLPLTLAIESKNISIASALILEEADVDKTLIALNNDNANIRLLVQSFILSNKINHKTEVPPVFKKELPEKINQCNKNGETLLHYFCDTCDKDAVKFILNNGGEVNVLNQKGNTPIHKICKLDNSVGNKEAAYILRLMIANLSEKKLDVAAILNAKNNEGCTALHYAASNCQSEMIERLLIHGAILDIADEKGVTPFQIICGNSNLATVKMAIKYLPHNQSIKNLLEEKNQHGKNCLECVTDNSVSSYLNRLCCLEALEKGHANVSAYLAKVNQMADLCAIQDWLRGREKIPNMSIISSQISEKIQDKIVKMDMDRFIPVITAKAKILAENTNADINEVIKSPIQTIGLTFKLKQIDEVDINALVHTDGTPFLIYLCRKATSWEKNQITILAALIDTYKDTIDLNITTNTMPTTFPLNEAIQVDSPNIELIKMLIDKGASIDEKLNPCIIAALNGDKKRVIKLLAEHGVDLETPLQSITLKPLATHAKLRVLYAYSEIQDQAKFTKFLIKHEINVNSPYSNGNTLLHYACIDCHMDTVIFLLKNDANKNCRNISRESPVDLAKLKKLDFTFCEDVATCYSCIDRNNLTYLEVKLNDMIAENRFSKEAAEKIEKYAKLHGTSEALDKVSEKIKGNTPAQPVENKSDAGNKPARPVENVMERFFREYKKPEKVEAPIHITSYKVIKKTKAQDVKPQPPAPKLNPTQCIQNDNINEMTAHLKEARFDAAMKYEGETLLTYALKQQASIAMIRVILSNKVELIDMENNNKEKPIDLAHRLKRLKIPQERELIFNLIIKHQLDKFKSEMSVTTKQKKSDKSSAIISTNDAFKQWRRSIEKRFQEINQLNLLQYHCQEGDYATVELLLQSDYDPNETCSRDNIVTKSALMLTLEKLALTDKTSPSATKLYNIANLLINSDKINTNVEHNKMTPLHIACQHNLTSCVQSLINNQTTQLDLTDDNDSTPLHVACEQGHADVVEVLVKSPRFKQSHLALLYKTNRHHDTPLSIATRKGHTLVVTELINAYRSNEKTNDDLKKIKDAEFIEALCIACKYSHVSIIQELADKIQPFNRVYLYNTSDNANPLLIAFENEKDTEIQKKGIVKQLIKYDINAALQFALSQGNVLLLREIMAVGHKAKHIKIEQSQALWQKLLIACDKGQIDILHLFYSNGILTDLNMTIDNTTLLHRASEKGHLDIVDWLLAANVKVNKCNNDNERSTPLHAAIKQGHTTIVGTLIQHQALIHATNSDGDMPIHLACAAKNKDVVKLLIDNKADITAKNKKGELPMTLADSDVDLFMMLATVVTNNFNQPLIIAARMGQPILAAMLIKQGADLKMEHEGKTALFLACEYGHLDIVKLIIEKLEADGNEKALIDQINRPESIGNGRTPLMVACEKAHRDVVEYLLAHKADVHREAEQTNRTALMSTSSQQRDIEALLIAAGAKGELSQTPSDNAQPSKDNRHKLSNKSIFSEKRNEPVKNDKKEETITWANDTISSDMPNVVQIDEHHYLFHSPDDVQNDTTDDVQRDKFYKIFQYPKFVPPDSFKAGIKRITMKNTACLQIEGALYEKCTVMAEGKIKYDPARYAIVELNEGKSQLNKPKLLIPIAYKKLGFHDTSHIKKFEESLASTPSFEIHLPKKQAEHKV